MKMQSREPKQSLKQDYQQHIKKIQVKRLLKYDPKQVEILLLANAFCMDSMECLRQSNNKKIMIAHEQEYEAMTPNMKRKFDLIIVVDCRDSQLIKNIFQKQILEGEKDIIKGDLSKVKIAALGDVDLDIVGLIRTEFNIPGEHSYQRFNNKYMTYDLVGKYMGVPKNILVQGKQLLNETGEVKSELIKKISQKLGEYPYFAKPANGTSSKMIGQIRNPENLLEYIKNWKDSELYDDFLLSEMLDCKLYEIDAIFCQGKLVGPVMVSENVNLWHKLQMGLPTGVIVLKPHSPQHKKYCDVLDKIIQGLGTIDGVYCIEVFERDNGEPVLLEVNPRRPSNLFNSLYKSINGLDWESISILSQWGYNFEIDDSLFGTYGATVQFPTKEGTIKEIKAINLPNNSKTTIDCKVKVGEMTIKSDSTRAISIFILISGIDYEKLYEDWRYLVDHCPIIYEE